MSRRQALVEDIAHFRMRVLQDALNEACSAYWLRRADDFNVVGTPECDQVALACRRKAGLALLGGTWPEIADLLAEMGDTA
jgi:hypothetical protein